MGRNHIYPIILALTAAVLFGASAPLAKLLLGEVEPIPLAALLYLGSGLGLIAIRTFQQSNHRLANREAQIRRADLFWLAGALLAGGVAAPITLLFGLQYTPAATASLLLNFEVVATTVIAALAFKEAISRRAWQAIALITFSSILLSINFNGDWGISIGAIGIIVACILWGIDNNFTRNISAKDPLMIVSVKGLGAGSFSLALAIVLGSALPPLNIIVGAMLLGVFSYGVSIVLFIRAMRGLGAARTSALFGTAPLAGVMVSLLLFQEFPGWMFVIALPLMVGGTIFLVREEHDHHHVHEMTTHEHAHVHDDGHHDHDHPGEYARKHSHVHRHDAVAHDHHHMPDLHHRHIHSVEQ